VVLLAEITGECPESTFADWANGGVASTPSVSDHALIGAPTRFGIILALADLRPIWAKYAESFLSITAPSYHA